MSADVLSLKLQALADPTRRAMLSRLRSGEATVNELAEPFAMSLPAISNHIKVLEKAGLITRSRIALHTGSQRTATLQRLLIGLATETLARVAVIGHQRVDVRLYRTIVQRLLRLTYRETTLIVVVELVLRPRQRDELDRRARPPIFFA